MFRYTFASVDSKEVVWPGMLQNAVRFASIAKEALRPDWCAPEKKKPARMLALQDRGTMLSRKYNMRVSILCQGKKVRSCRGSFAILSLGAVSSLW